MIELQKLQELKKQIKSLQNEAKTLETEIIEQMKKDNIDTIEEGQVKASLIRFHKYSNWKIETVKRLLKQYGVEPTDYLIKKVKYTLNKEALEQEGLFDQLKQQPVFDSSIVQYLKVEAKK